MPLPCRSNGTVPELVVNVSEASAPPVAVGENFTGTLMVCPALRLTGSDGGVAVKGAVVEIAVMVVDFAAVTVTVLVELDPTLTLPKSVGDPVSDDVVGRPKAITLPSRVPM